LLDALAAHPRLVKYLESLPSRFNAM